MEFWVVDERGRLCDAQGLTDAHERIEPEFIGPLLEVRTEPHERELDLRRDLQRTLRTAIREATAAGKHLVPLGTPVAPASPPATGERGELFEDIYGEGIEPAKNCAGTHVHFERERPRRQLNLLTALDPALALVSSSPYYCGERRTDSSRADAYRRACGADFERYCGLRDYVDSPEEWISRAERDYERFEALAADRGVDEAAVREHFGPRNAMLNPVKLHGSLPTVEWRAPDTALPTQVLRLASDTRRIVEQTETKDLAIGAETPDYDHIGIPEFDRLRELSRGAIRWGLGSEQVRAYLEGMGFDVSAYEPISRQLQGPQRIEAAEAREIRLEYAKRLRADVGEMTTEAGAIEERPGQYAEYIHP